MGFWRVIFGICKEKVEMNLAHRWPASRPVVCWFRAHWSSAYGKVNGSKGHYEIYLLVFGGNEKKKTKSIQLRIPLTRFTFCRHKQMCISMISSDSIGLEHCVVLQHGSGWKCLSVGYGFMLKYDLSRIIETLDTCRILIDLGLGCRVELKVMHGKNSIQKGMFVSWTHGSFFQPFSYVLPE